MGELSLQAVSDMYLDVLKEIGNIGAGNAMTALSQMMQCKVDMRVPQVRLLEFQEMGDVVGGEENTVVGVFLGVDGDITGSMMFMVDIESTKHLLEKVMPGMTTPGAEFSEMELSCVKEIGNIITGAYLNSLSTLTNLKIYPQPPEVAIDMAGAILSVPAIQFGIMGDKMLMIESQFFDEIEINGYFVLIPDVDSYTKILTSLGIPVV